MIFEVIFALKTRRHSAKGETAHTTGIGKITFLVLHVSDAYMRRLPRTLRELTRAIQRVDPYHHLHGRERARMSEIYAKGGGMVNYS